MVYTVKAVDTTGALNATEIDTAVDTLLHLQTLTVTGWGNYWTARETDIAYNELVGGVMYYHRGGQYRIRVATS
jgi:hypothetical protein